MGNLFDQFRFVTNNNTGRKSLYGVLENLRLSARTSEECEKITEASLRSLGRLSKRDLFEDIIMYYDNQPSDNDGVDRITLTGDDEEEFYLEWPRKDDVEMRVICGQPRHLSSPANTVVFMNYAILKKLLFDASDSHPHVTSYVLYKLWEVGKLSIETCVKRLDRTAVTPLIKTMNQRGKNETMSFRRFLTVFDRFYVVDVSDFKEASSEHADRYRDGVCETVIDGDHTYSIVSGVV